jgi:hypothetical protein
MLLPSASGQKKRYYLRNAVLWIVVLVLGIFFLNHVISNLTKPTQGFASYYTASRLFLNGENPSRFYNDDWFSSKVLNYVPGVYEVYLVNMPTTVFLTLPVAGFNYETSRIIWLFFNLLFLSVIITIIIKKYNFNNIWLPLVLILFLTFQPLYVNISYAQVYIFIFCLLALIWFAYQSRYDKTLGVLLGLIFMIKTAGFFLWILLVIQKKWKSLSWIFITVAISFLITLPFLGIDSWFAYINKLQNYSESRTLVVTAYQTVSGFFHHFFMFDEYWNPYPLTNLPLAAKLLTILFSLLLMIITIISAIRFKKSELAFGSFIIIGTILNPASIDYHFVLLLIPIIILFKSILENPLKNKLLLFIFSFILIALNFPYTSEKVTKGVAALFAYPKLYGAIGLWILCLWESYRSNEITG